jgi:NitT/TauT family transport system permease protein
VGVDRQAGTAEGARVWVARGLFTGAALALWEGGVRGGLVNPFWVSSPAAIAVQAWRLYRDGALLPHVQETLTEMLLGLVGGCAVGVPLGLVLGALPPVRRVVEPYLVVLNAFPKIALAPLYLVWFGISLSLKVAMAFSLVVFVMALGTVAGFGGIRQDWINHGRLLGASRLQIARVVLAPALMPWIYTSFKLSVGFALMGAVLGEFIATQRGIGYLIDQGVGMFDTTTVFVGLLLLLALALLLNASTEWVGARLRILNVQLRNQQVL